MKTDHIPAIAGQPEAWMSFVPTGAYVLTPSELEEALRETVRIAREYWGCLDTERVATAAAAEMLGRLEGER